MSLDRSARWLRVRAALRWTGLLLMVWAASGLPFDLLTAAGLMGHRTASGEIVLSTVYWPALATRAFALAAVVVLARLTLAHPAAPASTRPPAWFGYVAFVLALPYPRSQGPLGAGRNARAHVARRGRRGLGAVADRDPVGARGRSVPAPRLTAALDAATAVAGGGLVRHRHRRHDRPGGLLGLRRAHWPAAAIWPRARSTSGSSVSSTAAGSSGRSPVGPQLGRISRGVPRARCGWQREPRRSRPSLLPSNEPRVHTCTSRCPPSSRASIRSPLPADTGRRRATATRWARPRLTPISGIDLAGYILEKVCAKPFLIC